eukprot:gene19925-25886_t
MSKVSRSVKSVRSPGLQQEGGGFIVRRTIGFGSEVGNIFLLLDHLDYNIAPGVGFPGVMHPHRGFETVGYQLQGSLIHECMSGVKGVMTDGDAQWMTAGRGVVHGGGSTPDFKKRGGPVEAFQIWVNLPRKYKMVPPKYQDIHNDQIPVARVANGLKGSTVKIISGSYENAKGACSTLHPVEFYDIRLQPGDNFTLPTEINHVAFLYVYRGSIVVNGSKRSELQRGQGSELTNGNIISVSVNEDVQLLEVPAPHTDPETSDKIKLVGAAFILLLGAPIDEPIARGGPFVMNTEEEIEQCFKDYRSGKIAAESKITS